MSAPAKILAAGAISLAFYAALAAAGDLTARVPLFLAAHAALLLLMLAAWRVVRSAPAATMKLVLAAAIAFRLVAALAPASLSGDVYRYVWDGRVQAAGHHPYKFAPGDPMRAALRDHDVYPKINHPEIPTIYPPLAEILFAVLAALKLGVTGFKLATALLDVGVVLALIRLLDALEMPADRVVLYAWNPLAVVETSMSGHIEPLGLVFVVLGVGAIVRGAEIPAAAALAAAVQSKLLPLILLPGFVRRLRTRAVLVAVAVVVLITVPYAVRGPWYGTGLFAYAHRWEHGAVIFAIIRRLFAWLDLAPQLTGAVAAAQARWPGAPAFWDLLYRLVWPQELARITVAAAAVAWAIAQSFRPGLTAAREARLSIGGALLLAPTLHPWYVLWVLPLAVAEAAWGWLLLAALVPLGYLAGPGDDLTWGLRLAIVLPAVAWMACGVLVRSRR